MCGTAPWEWEDDKYAYETEDRFCMGCYLKEVASGDRKRLPGTTVELVKLTKTQKAKRLIAERHRSINRRREQREDRSGRG